MRQDTTIYPRGDLGTNSVNDLFFGEQDFGTLHNDNLDADKGNDAGEDDGFSCLDKKDKEHIGGDDGSVDDDYGDEESSDKYNHAEEMQSQ